MLRQISRCFQSSPVFSSSTKSALLTLRKTTGYTFANCKKALELNNNDLLKAEKWLKDQAQALGWSKATKLEGRATAQGLVGLALKNNLGVMVEVNCETDFVARNKTFQSLVEIVTAACLKQMPSSQGVSRTQQTFFDADDLKTLPGPENKSLSDHTALAISSVGENITLRRALIVSAPRDILIAGYTHPSPDNHSAKVMTGKYGSLVAYVSPSKDSNCHHIAKQLCQHIVGMNPSKVGETEVDEPMENQEEETVMIHQDFLLDPSTTVGQLIEGVGLQIIDFWRYECGENIQTIEDSEPAAKASQAA